MHCSLARRRLAAWLVLGLAGVIFGAPPEAPAQVSASNPFAVQPAKPSWTESITSGVRRGWAGLTKPFSAKPAAKPGPDPTSLSNPARPSPRLHVEVARLHENSGRFDEAERHYQAALAMDRHHLGAMLGYARLHDRRGKSSEAFELYRRAVQVHSEEPAVYNHLGLHYDRRRMPKEAAATFAKAVRLRPDEPLYRNNLAHVLVQLDELPAAYEHLHTVHGEAVAYYNLGYLLHQRGRRDAAVQHLAAALRRNPNLGPARQLMSQLRASGSAHHLEASRPPRSPAARPSAPAAGVPARRPVPSQALPQRPARAAPPPPPGRAPIPHRSSTGLQQPEGIARDEVRLNAPHIQLTGAALPVVGE